MFIIYKVVGQSTWSFMLTDLAFYATRDLAEAKIKEMKKRKDWRKNWKCFGLEEVKVEGDLPSSGWRDGDVDRQSGAFTNEEIIHSQEWR